MLKVVLAVDEQIILNGLQSFIVLKDFGCEVAKLASDSLGGFKLIRTIKPDILLTDIHMPNIDGIK